ncbi:MAG: hypothetical protein IJ484_03560 [Oscillospiraceae bacterium]|nr:hypothetical protein [Oscillospiraceae bacterium]
MAFRYDITDTRSDAFIHYMVHQRLEQEEAKRRARLEQLWHANDTDDMEDDHEDSLLSWSDEPDLFDWEADADPLCSLWDDDFEEIGDLFSDF